MPYDWAQPDDIFTNEQNYLKPINQVYAYIPEGFNPVSYTHLDVYKRQVPFRACFIRLVFPIRLRPVTTIILEF